MLILTLSKQEGLYASHLTLWVYFLIGKIQDGLGELL
jgi:hypothetical protein